LYWSLRRELWENRSITIAPLIVAAVVLFGFLISTFRLASKIRSLLGLDPAQQQKVVVLPYSMAASVIILAGFVIGVFYCLDALNGERRDRSILFWKSLPVSDRVIVLSKACVPLLVQPLLSFVVALTVQLVMLVLSTVVLLGNGLNPMALWTRLPLIQMTFVMLYGLTVHALWFAPIYSWLLLVSAWARRVTFLWAALPFFAIYVVERLAFGRSSFAALLKYRVIGAMAEAFSLNTGNASVIRVWQLTPLKFLGSSGLWLGLIVAALFLAAAVRLRRNREPI
jgi:ABC-2 type transport system permease protein